MVDLGDLKKRISEIVSDLHATREVVEEGWDGYELGEEVYAKGGYYAGSSPWGSNPGEKAPKWIVKTIRVPDETTRNRASQDLEELVRNTEPALLVQVPEPIVLDKVGEVYGADATPHLIHVFTEQKSELLRDALSKFGDESSLPFLWQEIVSKGSLSEDHSATRGYLGALARIKGQYEFIRMIVDDRIQPSALRQDAYDYVFTPHGARTFTREFWDAFHTVRDLVEQDYWKTDFNDFRITLMLLQKDPAVIMEVYSHPPSEPSRYARAIFYKFGEGIQPTLMSTLTSEDYPAHVRSHSAKELAYLRDEEGADIDLKLLELRGTPSWKYAAKALMGAGWYKGYNKTPLRPEVVDSFLSDWRDIDEADWKNALSHNSEITQKLVDILTDKNQNRNLRCRTADLLVNFIGKTGYNYDGGYSRNIPLTEEARREAIYKIVEEGCEDGDVFRPLFGQNGFGQRVLGDVYRIARDKSENPATRINAIKTISRYSSQYGDWWNWILRDVKGYLRRAGSSLFGRFFEPNEEIRLVAREAYSKIF